MTKETILKLADEIFDTMVTARRAIHQKPELGGNEYETQKYIMNFLNELGIEHKKIADTGVLGIIRGRSGGKTIALRADIDALPITETNTCDYKSQNEGVMHACGHDAHTAVLLGAAKMFNTLKDDLEGNIKLFFQPAEESLGGAERMIKEGCMENPKVDYVLGLHVMSYLPYNKIELKYDSLNASTDTLNIKVKGITGHGAYPDKCVDAITIACQLVCALQSIISRNISPNDSAVITIGKIEGGTGSNIIAPEVNILGTIRASNNEIRQILHKRIHELSTSLCTAMGGECEVIISQGYNPLVNNNSIIDIVKETAIDYLGGENVAFKDSMSMGGEDFSFFIENTPGAFYSVGCLQGHREPHLLHIPDFDIDERCLKTGLIMQTLSALKLLK